MCQKRYAPPLSMGELNILNILEATADELEEAIHRLEASGSEAFYAQILKHYLRGQSEEMLTLLEGLRPEVKNDSQWKTVIELSELRLCIRQNKVCEKTLAKADIETLEMETPWKAETAFTWAMYWDVHRNDPRAKDLYLYAQKLFLECGLRKKAAKSFQNSVAAESRINPSRRLIPEYHCAAQMAKDAKDYGTAGTALSNLSREFQLMKAPHVALKIVNEALEYLRLSAYGTYQFYNALCNRCHLNIELEYFNAAIMDFEEASAAPFVEVKAQLGVLQKWIEEIGYKPEVKKDSVEEKHLRPRWAERMDKASLEQNKLSELEAQLVHILLEGSQDRHYLIEKLWGTQSDFFALENRFKQLVHRLRKKEPTLLGFKEGKYFLLDSPQVFSQGTL